MQPRTHLRHTPDPDTSLAALFYLEAGEDVYGWYTEACGRRFSAAFFMLEDFYAERDAALYRSLEDDVYGRWIAVLPGTYAIRNPLPEPVRHEVDRIQSQFVRDWLFFDNDPEAAIEIATYEERGLTPIAVNVRSRRLRKLATGPDGIREHLTPGTDRNIMDFLVKHWRRGESRAAGAAGSNREPVGMSY